MIDGERTTERVEQSPLFIVPGLDAQRFRSEILRGDGVTRWPIPGGMIFVSGKREGIFPAAMVGVMDRQGNITGRVEIRRGKQVEKADFAMIRPGYCPSEYLIKQMLGRIERDFPPLGDPQGSQRLIWRWSSFLDQASKVVDRTTGRRKRQGKYRRMEVDLVCDEFDQALAQAESTKERDVVLSSYARAFRRMEEGNVRNEPPLMVVSGGSRLENLSGFLRMAALKDSWLYHWWAVLRAAYLYNDGRGQKSKGEGGFSRSLLPRPA